MVPDVEAADLELQIKAQEDVISKGGKEIERI